MENEDSITVDGIIYKESDARNLLQEIDVVLNAQASIRLREINAGTSDAGAKKVLISAPAGND